MIRVLDLTESKSTCLRAPIYTVRFDAKEIFIWTLFFLVVASPADEGIKEEAGEVRERERCFR
jgi:hypothetical protein